MTAKIYLGRLKPDHQYGGEAIYMEKHNWSCGWYWSFGCLGNRNLHFHFESFLKGAPKLASELFAETPISDADWWVLRDLFKQAYALKAAAEVYQYGGHQTSRAGITDIIRDAETMPKRLNADLERVLNLAWDFLIRATTPKVAA